jgi:hypothetical protein
MPPPRKAHIHVYINSIHLTSKEECEVVNIDELAGRTADDYHDYVTQSLDNLVELSTPFVTTDNMLQCLQKGTQDTFVQRLL